MPRPSTTTMSWRAASLQAAAARSLHIATSTNRRRRRRLKTQQSLNPQVLVRWRHMCIIA